MFKVTTISEELLYVTIRLVASDGSTGTGFLFHFRFKEQYVPIIVTNQHVINHNTRETVTVCLHVKKEYLLSDQNITVIFQPNWHFHPEHDLCFCFATPLFDQVKQNEQKNVFYKCLNEDIIYNNQQLEELSAVEDVLMVGYPISLWDQKNNLPLFRKGITASHPAIDFNNKSMGAVDIAAFPGSSGSPIFILNEGIFHDKKGSHLAESRFIFLGVLSSGPRIDAKGELVIDDIPTKQTIIPVTPLMINLGYYIKAREILTFRQMIENLGFGFFLEEI
jgi:hypothetical protein